MLVDPAKRTSDRLGDRDPSPVPRRSTVRFEGCCRFRRCRPEKLVDVDPLGRYPQQARQVAQALRVAQTDEPPVAGDGPVLAFLPKDSIPVSRTFRISNRAGAHGNLPLSPGVRTEGPSRNFRENGQLANKIKSAFSVNLFGVFREKLQAVPCLVTQKELAGEAVAEKSEQRS